MRIVNSEGSGPRISVNNKPFKMGTSYFLFRCYSFQSHLRLQVTYTPILILLIFSSVQSLRAKR